MNRHRLHQFFYALLRIAFVCIAHGHQCEKPWKSISSSIIYGSSIVHILTVKFTYYAKYLHDDCDFIMRTMESFRKNSSI